MSKSVLKKAIVIGVLLFLVVVLIQSDLHQQLTLNNLQEKLAKIQVYREHSPYFFAVGFFIIYVFVAAFSIPSGPLLLSLAAGALFGLWWGVLIVSFASTIGASLAFLAARFLFRDAVQKRFASSLTSFNEGFKKDGVFYLLSLRLIPISPFILINLVMALTTIRLRTFYWVSQLGMLLGTIVYVNAGIQLAQLKTLTDIMSPKLILAFSILGVFPLIAKFIIEKIKHQRLYKAWQRPKRFDYNLVVIGAGAGGLVSSYIAATVKAKVTLVESNKMGGDCLNYGCVPSKTLIKAAKLAYQTKQTQYYGLNNEFIGLDFPQLMQRIQHSVKAIEPHDSVERYTQLGVDVKQAYAEILDPWRVKISSENHEEIITTRTIIIAAGAESIVPDIQGLSEIPYYTSDTLWDAFTAMSKLPKRIVILGGGPIACELSQSFTRLGADLTIIEKNSHILKEEDEDVSQFVEQTLKNEGVNVLTNHQVQRCFKNDTNNMVELSVNGESKLLCFDVLICAVGRKARLDGYGLDKLGIETDKTVSTDSYLATVYPNIYAVGDVAGPYQLTHVAAHQAWYASVNALFGKFNRFKADYRVIPRVTFVDPEVARVGLNERQAQLQGISYEATIYPLSDLDRAIIEGENKGFIKVLTVPNKDKILGVSIVGHNAGEYLPEFVLAMKHKLGLNKILGTTHAYPTMAEANKYVAGEWKKQHAPTRLLRWVEKYHQWMRGE